MTSSSAARARPPPLASPSAGEAWADDHGVGARSARGSTRRSAVVHGVGDRRLRSELAIDAGDSGTRWDLNAVLPSWSARPLAPRRGRSTSRCNYVAMVTDLPRAISAPIDTARSPIRPPPHLRAHRQLALTASIDLPHRGGERCAARSTNLLHAKLAEVRGRREGVAALARTGPPPPPARLNGGMVRGMEAPARSGVRPRRLRPQLPLRVRGRRGVQFRATRSTTTTPRAGAGNGAGPRLRCTPSAPTSTASVRGRASRNLGNAGPLRGDASPVAPTFASRPRPAPLSATAAPPPNTPRQPRDGRRLAARGLRRGHHGTPTAPAGAVRTAAGPPAAPPADTWHLRRSGLHRGAGDPLRRAFATTPYRLHARRCF